MPYSCELCNVNAGPKRASISATFTFVLTLRQVPNTIAKRTNIRSWQMTSNQIGVSFLSHESHRMCARSRVGVESTDMQRPQEDDNSGQVLRAPRANVVLFVESDLLLINFVPPAAVFRPRSFVALQRVRDDEHE